MFPRRSTARWPVSPWLLRRSRSRNYQQSHLSLYTWVSSRTASRGRGTKLLCTRSRDPAGLVPAFGHDHRTAPRSRAERIQTDIWSRYSCPLIPLVLAPGVAIVTIETVYTPIALQSCDRGCSDFAVRTEPEVLREASLKGLVRHRLQGSENLFRTPSHRTLGSRFPLRIPSRSPPSVTAGARPPAVRPSVPGLHDAMRRTSLSGARGPPSPGDPSPPVSNRLPALVAALRCEQAPRATKSRIRRPELVLTVIFKCFNPIAIAIQSGLEHSQQGLSPVGVTRPPREDDPPQRRFAITDRRRSIG